jgi:predicted nucleic acid-binding protein
MSELVYLETSIFSFYYDQRTAPSAIARREWTQEWWERDRTQYQLLTSTAVYDELRRGTKPQKDQALALALTIPAVSPTHEIGEIVQVYTAQYVMPRDPLGDALHLALASYHKCDYLLTWNCDHLANARKFGHIRRVNMLLGLHNPLLVTPLELKGGENHDG